MATNLGTDNAASFNTANMKPASGEQIDALWGQNMADDLAFLRWNGSWATKKLFSFGPSFCPTHDEATYPREDGTLIGTKQFVCYGTDGAGTISGTVRVSIDAKYANLDTSRGTAYVNGNELCTFSTTTGREDIGFTYVMDSSYAIGNLYEASLEWKFTKQAGRSIAILEGCDGFLFPTAESVK